MEPGQEPFSLKKTQYAYSILRNLDSLPICSRTRNHTEGGHDTHPHQCAPPRSNPAETCRPHSLPTPGPYTPIHPNATSEPARPPGARTVTRPYTESTHPLHQSPPSPTRAGGAWPRRRSPVESCGCRARNKYPTSPAPRDLREPSLLRRARPRPSYHYSSTTTALPVLSHYPHYPTSAPAQACSYCC
jgi:hypothetical protein